MEHRLACFGALPPGLRWLFLARACCSVSAKPPPFPAMPRPSATGFRKTNADLRPLVSIRRPSSPAPSASPSWACCWCTSDGAGPSSPPASASFGYFLAFTAVYRDRRSERRYRRSQPHPSVSVETAGHGSVRSSDSRSAPPPTTIVSTCCSRGCPAISPYSLHLNVLQSAWYTSIPWLVATVHAIWSSVVGWWTLSSAAAAMPATVRQSVLIGGTLLGIRYLCRRQCYDDPRRCLLDQRFTRRTGRRRSRRMVGACLDRAARRRRPRRRPHELRQPDRRYLRSDHHRLRRRDHSFVQSSVLVSGRLPRHRHCGVRTATWPYRTDQCECATLVGRTGGSQ